MLVFYGIVISFVRVWGIDMKSHLEKMTIKSKLRRYNVIKETIIEKWKGIVISQREINIRTRKYYQIKNKKSDLTQMPLLDVIDKINTEIIIVTDIYEVRLWHQFGPDKTDTHHVGGCHECGEIIYHYNNGDVGLCFENREVWPKHRMTRDVNSVTCGRCMRMTKFKEAYRDNMAKYAKYNGCCDSSICGVRL